MISSGQAVSVQSQQERIPRQLNIDRPIDDEFVQHFVRNGETKVTLAAEAVTNLCSQDGARQILVEGVHLLRTSSYYVWPLSKGYTARLEMLAKQG